LGNLLVVSSMAGSLQPASSNSSDTTPAPIATATPATPEVTIKDKPSDLGIKPIKDKESWINARKVIDARLRQAPYWSGPDGKFITTPDNAAASGWWEEVLAFTASLPSLISSSAKRNLMEKVLSALSILSNTYTHLGPSTRWATSSN
jgi:hypothetical protein